MSITFHIVYSAELQLNTQSIKKRIMEESNESESPQGEP